MAGSECWPIKTLIIVLMMYLLWVFFGSASEQLIYDRVLISQGEIWRLLTAHLVHLDSEHLILNLAALLVLGSLLEYLQPDWLAPALIIGVLVVTTGLWFNMPSLLYYCGFSGVLNTLLVVVLWSVWCRSQYPLVLILGVVNILKIFVELVIGKALFSSILWPPVPEAHFLGVLGGLIMIIWLRNHFSNAAYRQKSTDRKPHL
jgi:rhomboid family GlyGly-CTERM serine protease